MNVPRHSESAFETVIEAHLLAHGYVSVPNDGFDRERAIFPETILTFISETQPKEWTRLEALLGGSARTIPTWSGRTRPRRLPASYGCTRTISRRRPR